jgi:hypothetical protein
VSPALLQEVRSAAAGKQVTDRYLLGFARRNGGQVATFDRALAMFGRGDVVCLLPAHKQYSSAPARLWEPLKEFPSLYRGRALASGDRSHNHNLEADDGGSQDRGRGSLPVSDNRTEG